MNGKNPNEAFAGGASLIGLEDADAMPGRIELELAGLVAAARAAERLGRWWAVPSGKRSMIVSWCRSMAARDDPQMSEAWYAAAAALAPDEDI